MAGQRASGRRTQLYTLPPFHPSLARNPSLALLVRLTGWLRQAHGKWNWKGKGNGVLLCLCCCCCRLSASASEARLTGGGSQGEHGWVRAAEQMKWRRVDCLSKEQTWAHSVAVAAAVAVAVAAAAIGNQMKWNAHMTKQKPKWNLTKKKNKKRNNKKLSTKKRKGLAWQQSGKAASTSTSTSTGRSKVNPAAAAAPKQKLTTAEQPKISNGKRKPTAIIVIITSNDNRQRPKQQAAGSGQAEPAAGTERATDMASG